MNALEREELMRCALSLAREAAQDGEVPVGCVITDAQGAVVGRGRNCSRKKHDATAHAEMEAIRQAGETLGDWHLDGCTLTVTLEPCPMCTGAIMNSRIRTLVFGARDEIKGACGSVVDLFSENFPDKCSVYSNVLSEECGNLLTDFFTSVRKGDDR